MVNTEAFTKRINILLKYYNISAAQLAEKTEVQRSTISHIISGRNKPSLDFVLKVLKAFPEVEFYWLLNGVGDFPHALNNSTPLPPVNPPSEINQNNGGVKEVTRKNNQDHKENEVDRIVIFFKDGTFKNYLP